MEGAEGTTVASKRPTKFGPSESGVPVKTSVS